MFINTVYAQQPTDCINSVIVCGNSSIVLDVNGIGTQELSGSNTCASQETNSVWLQVTLVTDGTLGFTLTPDSTSIIEDYDFFVFGPNVSCNNIGQAIRCSTTNPQAAGQGNNLTGMNGTETDTAEGPGPNGNSFVNWLSVLEGETYFIVIDRPIGNSAFSLDWKGTAQFAEPPINESGANTALNVESCDVISPFDDGFTEFYLADKTNLIVGSQGNVIVSYHETESDANIRINQINTRGNMPYTNIRNPQTIYARITNTITGCFEIIDFELRVNLGPNFTVPTNLVACDNADDGDATNGQIIFDLQSKNSEILNGQNPLDINITYHQNITDAELGILALPNLYYNQIPNLQQIFVRIESAFNSLCFNTTTLNVIVNELPETFNTTLIQCDEDGVVDGQTIFNLTEASDALTGGIADRSTKFFILMADALTGDFEVDGNSFTNTANPQIIYVQVIDDISGCLDLAELILDVSTTSASNASLSVCDNDGTEDGFHVFDLSQADTDVLNGLPTNLSINYYETLDDALLEQDPLPNSYVNTSANSHIIHVRVEDDNACFGINKIELTVFELPDIEIEEETFYCLNFFPQTITLNAGLINNLPSDFSYLWSTGETTQEIQVNQLGIYTVRVTNTNGCTKDRTITVLPSNIATIENIAVVDATQNNTITVSVSGEGTYTFALDHSNGPYQDSNVFENVAPGFHTVFVMDIKNDCGIIEEIVSVIGFPKFFTPNNDSFNDTWQVYGLSNQFQPNTTIFIYNRYGKLLKQLDPTSRGWDGTFNGESLPTSDYWFHVTLQDGRVFRSHFTLKR